MNIEYLIKFIDQSHVRLAEVIQLADDNSTTLGHLPQIVYAEHAKKKCLLIAEYKNELVGYCLIRKTVRNNVVKIVHLCVKETFRGKKAAESLLDFVKKTYKKDFTGIGLMCREDYAEANKFWKKNRFFPIKEKNGRSQQGSTLIYWFYSFNKPNLFSDLVSRKVQAVIDINILIKLRDMKGENEKEIQALFSDSIISEVDYFVAKETYHEILRDKNSQRRKKTRKLIGNFEIIETNTDLLENVADDLVSHFTESVNDISDRYQISEVVAGGLSYFITTDDDLIKKRDKIIEDYSIEIFSPVEFLLQIEQIIDSKKYVGSRLAGTYIKLKEIASSEISSVISTFINTKGREKKITFKEKVSQCCISQDIQAKVVLKENQVVGFWALNKIDIDKTYSIPILRINDKQLHPYLFKQLLSESIHQAIKKKMKFLIFEDFVNNEIESDILRSFGFVNKDDEWKKTMLHGIHKFDNLVKDKYNCILKEIDDVDSLETKDKYQIERLLYPVKIADVDIANYIIPIKPFWAGQLFDYKIAANDLFGSTPHLIWNRENVYYRSFTPNIEKIPARILWYISSSKEEPRSKGISACSYLDNINVDRPKILYRQFKKYGIYGWNNVYKLAKNDINNKIKVLEFSDTEVFNKLLIFSDLQNILGRKITIQSPVKISTPEYMSIYKHITNNE